MRPLHAHALYICIVQEKYQKTSVNALVQVDFPVYALSKHKQNPYLQANRNKWLSAQSCHFVRFFYGIKLHANVQCDYIAYAKYQMALVKSLVQVDFPVHALTEH